MKFRQPSLGTKAAIFLPFLMSWTRAHFRMAELGCLASIPLQDTLQLSQCCNGKPDADQHAQCNAHISIVEIAQSHTFAPGLQSILVFLSAAHQGCPLQLAKKPNKDQGTMLDKGCFKACFRKPRHNSRSSSNTRWADSRRTHIFSRTMPLAWEAPWKGFFHWLPK